MFFSRGDPDLYFRASCKLDGTEYYEYLLVYVDDILCISHATDPIMKAFADIYRLKEGLIGPPERYLGADIGKINAAAIISFARDNKWEKMHSSMIYEYSVAP